MKSKKVLRLGTRASALALTQSRTVARLLERAHKNLRVELIEISTTGDRVTGQSLASFGGAGVFVKELEAALLDKRVDFAVHSLKDVPTQQPKGLLIAAISPREDPRDALVSRGNVPLEQMPRGSVIGSGSPRRRMQLKARFPQLEFAEIRGNVDTRLRKVDEGRYAGTILALAGLKRLGLHARASAILPFDLMLPAPGQGALGLECRAADRATRRFLNALHDAETAACVNAERALLEALGGGCHLPLGTLGEMAAKKSRSGGTPAALRLRAVLGHPDGSYFLSHERTGSPKSAKKLGAALGQDLLNLGGKELIARLREEGMAGV
ncbi:MAG TPA: hydroxymethylbilane synthase [Planctomycetota bacterium]|nr:hydroxymethylbilane synthase [Planctomycetota bacterium]